jgi:hypothetical protein
MPIFQSPESGKPHIEPAGGSRIPSGEAEGSQVDPAKARVAASEYRDPPQWTKQFEFDPVRKQQIVDMVLLDEETNMNAMQPFLSRIQEIIKLYEQERDGKAEPFQGASNLTAGDVPVAVENMHPRLFGAVNQDPLANYRAENAPSVRNLPKVTKFMNWAYRVDMPDTVDKLDEHVHSSIMLGTQPVWIRWEKLRNVYWDFESVQAGGPEEITRKTEIIERGAFDNLNLEDFLVPITEGKDLHKMSNNIRVYNLTVQEIRELIQRKHFQSPGDAFNWDEAIDSVLKKEDGEELERLRSAGFSLPEIRQRKRLRLLEWHGLYDAEGEGFRSECVFTVAKNLRLYLAGRYQPSPDGRRPFETTWLIPRKNFYFGIGIPEMIRLLAKERDAIHNQRIDAGSVSIIPFGFYRAASGFKPDKITLQPGTWIPMDDPQRDAQFANFSNPSTVLASEEAMTQAQIEKLSIAGSFQLGRESEIFKSRATARGTQLVVGQGNIRFNLLGERVKRGVARILDRITTLYQRFLPPGLSERVLGDDGKQIFPQGLTRADLRGKFSAYLTGDTEAANTSVSRQIATLMYQALLQNPLVIRSPGRVWEVTAQFLKSYSRDVKVLIGEKPPDPQSFIEQARMVIEDIKQGFAPEIRPTDDLMGLISGLGVFKESVEFSELPQGRQGLVDQAITTARNLLVQAMGRAIQQQAQGGQGQQAPGEEGPAQPTFIGEQEVPVGGGVDEG